MNIKKTPDAGPAGRRVRRFLMGCFLRISKPGKLPVFLPLPFSLFLPAYPRRAIRAVFGPAGLRREHGPALDAVFHLVPAPADLGAQGRIQQ